MNSDIKLTILIPTYNRKNQLIELLKSIEEQGFWGEYKILICDNHSDYNVIDSVESYFSTDFCQFIRYNIWNFNTGMTTNISVPILLVDTEWCWMISDDDFVCEGALEYVLKVIKKNSDVLAIKNSIEGFLPHEDRSLNSIKEFVDYYRNPNRGGELYYLSMLYNLSNLKPYLTYLTCYSYTYLSFLLPLIFGLAEGKSIKLSPFASIRYRQNATDNWTKKGAFRTMLGIRTLMDIDFNVDDKLRKELIFVLTRNINSYFCTKEILQISSRFYRKLVWSNLYPLFKYNTSLMERLLCKIIYFVYDLSNINLVDSYTKLKSHFNKR